MADGGDVDKLCCEFFQLCVEKEQAKKLPAAERKQGKGTTVRKILKDGLGEKSDVISGCEASIMPKYQDKKTKKISDEDFVKKVLPEVAALSAKVKSADDPKAQAKLAEQKKKICAKLEEMKAGDGKGKSAAVVDRLTDTSKYTGAHKERFGADGKGKGLEGREDIADNSGYVGNYKGEGTYEKK